MKKLIIIFIFSLILSTPVQTFAIVDPLAVPNNRYGIHVIDENDLENAAALVNSSNGDWGYVTIVIREDDRDLQKWNEILKNLKNLHLIPIIRLATTMEDNYWTVPYKNDALEWAEFLHNLSWPIRNRYVVLFNEPNHAKEWGGIIDPEAYTEILTNFYKTLKDKSEDFFILPAGLDSSANNTFDTMDEELFIRRMLQKNPMIFEYLDGWTSHSYPNPHYKGFVSDSGRGTLQTFRWERQLLKSLGINKNLLVFITETGWPHYEGSINNNYYSADQISDMIFQAAETIWIDENIVAITPFILNYQGEPFINFSWKKPDSEFFYPQFDSYRSIAKIRAVPDQNDNNRYFSQTDDKINNDLNNKVTNHGLLSKFIEKLKNNKLLSFLFAIKNFSDFISRS